MVFHLSLSDCKSPLDSKNILSILADLNNAVVWMASTRFISNTSCPFTNLLVTVPNSTIRISITKTLIFHRFFSSLSMSGYLSVFGPSVIFTKWFSGTAKSTIKQVTYFLLTITSSSPSLGDPFVSQNPWEFYANSGLCTYYLLVWTNLIFSHSSQLITSPSLPCLLLYFVHKFAAFTYYMNDHFVSILT